MSSFVVNTPTMVQSPCGNEIRLAEVQPDELLLGRASHNTSWSAGWNMRPSMSLKLWFMANPCVVSPRIVRKGVEAVGLLRHWNGRGSQLGVASGLPSVLLQHTVGVHDCQGVVARYEARLRIVRALAHHQHDVLLRAPRITLV